MFIPARTRGIIETTAAVVMLVAPHRPAMVSWMLIQSLSTPLLTKCTIYSELCRPVTTT